MQLGCNEAKEHEDRAWSNTSQVIMGQEAQVEVVQRPLRRLGGTMHKVLSVTSCNSGGTSLWTGGAVTAHAGAQEWKH